MSLRGRERLVSVAPLPAGWRAAYAFARATGDVERLDDDDLLVLVRVSALAQFELEDGRSLLRPLVFDGDELTADDDDDYPLVALLAPGERPGWLRDAAIAAIQRARARRARR